MAKFRQFSNRFIENSTVLLFASVVIITFAQIVLRSVFHTTLSWADEVSRFCFVWLIYIGGAITIRENRNVCFDLFIDMTRGWVNKLAHILVSMINIAYLCIVIYLGGIHCFSSIGEYSPVAKLPMHLICLAVPVGGAFMLAEQIILLVQHAKGSADPSKSVKEEL